MIISRNKLRLHRKRRIRARINGTAKKPRLAVFRSLTSIEVQLIDDTRGVTLLHSYNRNLKVGNNIEGAKAVGKDIAKKALAKKINQVVFDRGGYKYHGKVKAVADGAREGGLKF
jgi:large subunit ribosomal protein L18